MIELKIKVKDDSRTQVSKFLVYSDVNLSHEDQTIKAYVDQAVRDFQGTPEEISVRALFFW